MSISEVATETIQRGFQKTFAPVLQIRNIRFGRRKMIWKMGGARVLSLGTH